MADLSFLPWVRTGAAAGLNATAATGGANRPRVAISFSLTKTPDSGTTTTTPQQITMDMLGPGDVVGIDPGQVIRTEPADGSSAVDTTVFAAIEFEEVALPWLFSPAMEDANHRLQPWICLIAVPATDGVALDPAGKRITIGTPLDARQELPDLSEAWAWAHVQYAQYSAELSSDPTAAQADLAVPGAAISRLLCPRVLEQDITYIACVVPTYMAGRVAGLDGTPDPTAAAAPAWDVGTTGEVTVTLPVYHHFTFNTGPAGDFRSLAKRLVHPPDVSLNPGTGLGARTLTDVPGAPGGMALPGMLEPANGPDWSPAPSAVTGPMLTELTPTGSAPQLRPTLYGAVQARIGSSDLASSTPAPPAWWTELNLDPRLRVAAGLGTSVVAAEREALVAAAWTQVDQTADVNAQLSRAQVARAVAGRSAAKHLTALDPIGLLRVMSPQAARAQVEVTLPTAPGAQPAATRVTTAWQLVGADADDPALAASVTAPYRRATRPRGLHAQHTPPPARQPAIASAALSLQLTPDQAVQERVLAERLSPQAQSFAQSRPDPLRELAPPVTFPFGMVTPLIELSSEAVLPGANTIPPDTALTLGTSPTMIAAYMVGLNTAASALLLWRGVPTDRRATPFTQFWDTRGQGAGDGDISPIAAWSADATLAAQVGGTSKLVLCVRSELLRRYPTTAVYATPAQPSATTGQHTVDITDTSGLHQPTFTASLPPDLHLFGFGDISTEQAIGTPGFFFILQEQASETRFGSDTIRGARPSGNQTHWPVASLGLTDANAASVAVAVRMPPAVAAIHARSLLPFETAVSGRLWAGGRAGDGSWGSLVDVSGAARVAGAVRCVAGVCAQAGELQVLWGTGDGRVWHVVGAADGSWSAVLDVGGQLAVSGAVAMVAGVCADTGEAQFALATADGHVWHTIRHADGSWQALGDVNGQVTLAGAVVAMAAVSAQAGEAQFALLTADGHLWHVVRHGDGSWSGPEDAAGQLALAAATDAVAAASTQAGVSQLVLVGADGRVRYAERHADGTWVATVDVTDELAIPAVVRTVVATSDQAGGLHVLLATADGHLYHAQRSSAGAWQTVDVNGEAQVPGPVRALAAASTAPNTIQMLAST